MDEHTPIEVDDEIGWLRDLLARAYDITRGAYRAADTPDPNSAVLDTEQLKEIADRLSEVSVRAEDLADSLIEQLRERSRKERAEAFTRDVADLPPLTTPLHDFLGNRERWYWCGAPNCPDCRRRGVIPSGLGSAR